MFREKTSQKTEASRALRNLNELHNQPLELELLTDAPEVMPFQPARPRDAGPARFVQIDHRVINLDSISLYSLTEEDGVPKLTVYWNIVRIELTGQRATAVWQRLREALNPQNWSRGMESRAAAPSEGSGDEYRDVPQDESE